MAVSHKGAISFGLVHIPVALYVATQNNDISFNQLHEADYSRIAQKKFCKHCNKEIKSSDIVRGYEYEKDKYVVVTDEELEAIKTEKDKSIQILCFADLEEIDPIFYEKSYYTIPDAGGEKAFELFRLALHEKQKVAVAKTVIGSKETLMAILPAKEGLLIETMHYQDEIKEIPKTYIKPEISQEEMKMAMTLIESMEKPFEPEQYKDEYQAKLRDLIAKKINGQEIVAAPGEAPQNNIIDLMEALQASIEQNKPKTKRGRKKTS